VLELEARAAVPEPAAPVVARVPGAREAAAVREPAVRADAAGPVAA